MHFKFGLGDIVGIVKRRFFWALIPFLILAIVGFALIGQMPAVYQSQARLIVEDQQIKNSWVQSAVSSDAQQRIEAVAARVTARDSLLLLANELNLFKDSSLSFSARAASMQRNTSILIERIQARRGNNQPSAITVTIEFRSTDPGEAQRVANRLLTAFVDRSIQIRNDIADDTTTFLREEEDKIRRDLDRVIEGISQIKQENPRALPENRSLYERSLERSVVEQTRVDNQIEQTEQELRLLQMQRPILLNSDNSLTRQEEELRTRRRELSALQREYQDSYPDVIALKDEVMALERDIDPSAYRRSLTREIEALSGQLRSLTEGDAEYREVEARREQMRAQLADAPRSNGRSSSMSAIQYDAQITTIQSRIEGLTRQRADLAEQIIDFESRLAETPVVEGQLYRLLQEQEQLEGDLARLRQNRAEAERSESLEEQSKAERFSVLEQPVRPDQPVSPNKPQLAVLAVGVAGMFAAIIALFPEVMFAKVRRREHLEDLLPNVRVIEVPRFDIGQSQVPQLVTLAICCGVSIVLTAALAWTGYQTLL